MPRAACDLQPVQTIRTTQSVPVQLCPAALRAQPAPLHPGRTEPALGSPRASTTLRVLVTAAHTCGNCTKKERRSNTKPRLLGRRETRAFLK